MMTPRNELSLIAFALRHPQWTRMVRPLPGRVHSDDAKTVATAIYETYCTQAGEIISLRSALETRGKEIDALRTELQMVTDRLLAVEATRKA